MSSRVPLRAWMSNEMKGVLVLLQDHPRLSHARRKLILGLASSSMRQADSSRCLARAMAYLETHDFWPLLWGQERRFDEGQQGSRAAQKGTVWESKPEAPDRSTTPKACVRAAHMIREKTVSSPPSSSHASRKPSKGKTGCETVRP